MGDWTCHEGSGIILPMRKILSFLIPAFALFCEALLSASPALAQQPPNPPAQTAQAVFAGGCFWCMEHDMKAIPGVLKVESGYTGGKEKNPTYQQVSMHRTGHFEAVRVTYDASRLNYNQLLTRYWKLIDPTDDVGQFCDEGPQYRSAIFVTAEQKPAAEASKAQLAKSGKIRGQIVTQILPLGEFWEAEEYHRDYAENYSADYNAYRTGCGRDQRLKEVWKN